MIPILLAFAACWPITKFTISVRPRRSSALLAFPVLLIAAAITITGYFAFLEQSNPGLEFPVEFALRWSFIAAIFNAWWIWREGSSILQRTAEMKARGEEALRIEEYEAAERAGARPKAGDIAQMAIRHRPEVAAEWVLIQELDGEWVPKFLQAIQADPQADARSVSDRISREISEAFPYARDDLRLAYGRIAGMNDDARREFRRAVFTLGDTAPPDRIAESILASGRYGEELYTAGNEQIRIRADGSIIAFRGAVDTDFEPHAFFKSLTEFLSSTGLSVDMVNKVRQG